MDMMFVFNSNCSEWDENLDYNATFARAQMARLSEVVTNRHWLYLRELFDAFGADATHISPIMGWNGPDAKLEYDVRQFDDRIEIHHNAKAIY